MLIEGPFESDYSLAIVNRRLALGLMRAGRQVRLHQRDNTTNYELGSAFTMEYPELASCFISNVELSSERIHSRYIYPPYTDRMVGSVRAVHCYGWEESAFPRKYVEAFNRDLDVISVMSSYVKEVLVQNGVEIPIEVVGLGADHILEYEPLPVSCFEPRSFHFVHISSCFPRKGADILVNAFCREFRRSEDVRLIIKTFANPHNDIEDIVAKSFAQYRQHAPIEIIWESFSPGEMRYVIENSQCLVAPSRGEGFGLPVAEAMLLGVPVIATIHGGHADLCSPEWMWPVEFRLAPAHTHLTEGESYWAEPDGDSVAARMREVYKCGREEAAARTERAKAYVRANFTWERVALSHEEACLRVSGGSNREVIEPRRSPIHIGFITTWNAKCGIAEYTRYLAHSVEPQHRISVFANRVDETVRPDESYVFRCWETSWGDLPASDVDELAHRIVSAGCDVVSIQYNFSLLSPATMQRLARRLRSQDITVLATLHSSVAQRFDELVQALKSADLVIVHRTEERDKLAAAGLERIMIQRQGIYVPEDLESRSHQTMPGAFIVSCFGFFLPPKGIYELLEAFESAAFVNPALRLKLINALYDLPESHRYASECMRFILQHGLADRVVMCTEFLDHDTILRELAASDLIVLPYTWSTESSSAAIRLPLASLTPVLCSDLDIFKEFAGTVHSYPADDVVALANRIVELSMDPPQLHRFEARQREFVSELSWSKVAAQFQSVVEDCLRRS